MSHAVRIHEPGGPDALRYEPYEPPAPGRGEALVAQRAVGVDFIDVYHRTGLYPLPALPHGIGMEAAGVVEALGAGVEGVRTGQRVAYAAGPPGAYADRRVIAADRLVPLPDDVDDVTAAALMLKGMTAEVLIRRAYRVEPGATVVFHAAAGGVGSIACRWLAALGATVIGTAGNDEKAAHALARGCAHTIVYGREDVAARVRELTDGRGADVVYDGVGRATFASSLDCLRPRGTLVAFGNASGPVPPLDVLTLARKGSLHLTRPVLFDYTASREELLACAGALFDALRTGATAADAPATWPLRDAAEAHRALEARRTTGSLVLLPG